AAAGDETAVLAQRVEGGAEQVAADVLDHEVGTAPVREVEHPRGHAFRPVVDDVVGAVVRRACELLVASGGRNHRRAPELRDLDGRVPHSAARGVDDDRLARTELAACHEHVPRGGEDDLAGGGRV